jgi:hypothetical protein
MTPASPRLLLALELLRHALPSTIRVSLRDTTDGAPALTLTRPDGKRSTVHLRDPEGLSPDAITPATPWAWLVTRATAAHRQRWRDRDENFIDLSGAVRLHVPSLLVDRTDLAPARRRAGTSPTPNTRNPFGDRASLVVRVLLEEPGRTWTTSALANEAGVSIATVSLVTEALSTANLIHVRRDGRERAIAIDNPIPVITQWARRYDWTRNTAVAFAAPVGAPERFLDRLPRVLGSRAARQWALTLHAGASLVAPHAKWDTIHVYVDADEPAQLLEIGTHAGWHPSATGSVVLLLPHYRTSVWHHTAVKRGLPVVSRTQLVIDLWDYPVRGREQAEHLMRTAGWFGTDG